MEGGGVVLIKVAKLACFTNLGAKLSDPKIGQNNFWTAHKKIVNKKKNTNILPIIVNDMYISNYKQNDDIFNEYFANQCTINDNGSVLPTFLSPKTDASLSQVSVTKHQVVNIIDNLNSNKTNKWDICHYAKIMCYCGCYPIPNKC